MTPATACRRERGKSPLVVGVAFEPAMPASSFSSPLKAVLRIASTACGCSMGPLTVACGCSIGTPTTATPPAMPAAARLLAAARTRTCDDTGPPKVAALYAWAVASVSSSTATLPPSTLSTWLGLGVGVRGRGRGRVRVRAGVRVEHLVGTGSRGGRVRDEQARAPCHHLADALVEDSHRHVRVERAKCIVQKHERAARVGGTSEAHSLPLPAAESLAILTDVLSVTALQRREVGSEAARLASRGVTIGVKVAACTE
eukprot:scaffold26203_cov65-Phaeocystis_antarctica.AAC.2